MSVPETIATSMRHTNELFESEVVQKQNFEALNRIYTAGARILPPGTPMVEGREQIKAFWKQAASALGVTGAKLKTIHAEAAGDGVVEIGSADLALGEGPGLTVKYVVHWKQEDGAWKWHLAPGAPIMTSRATPAGGKSRGPRKGAAASAITLLLK
jgi:ketosteroid isomerase-like protein